LRIRHDLTIRVMEDRKIRYKQWKDCTESMKLSRESGIDVAS